MHLGGSQASPQQRRNQGQRKRQNSRGHKAENRAIPDSAKEADPPDPGSGALDRQQIHHSSGQSFPRFVREVLQRREDEPGRPGELRERHNRRNRHRERQQGQKHHATARHRQRRLFDHRKLHRFLPGRRQGQKIGCLAKSQKPPHPPGFEKARGH